MARQKNDGRGRLGGRAKGTPNKVTASVREWLSLLIDKNRRQFERDLKALEPKERITVLEKLMQYVVPKQAAVFTEEEPITMGDVDLSGLSDEELEVLCKVGENILKPKDKLHR